MGRKSESDSALALVCALVGLGFVILGYIICFFEKIHKYNLWINFWKTSLPLVIANVIAYFIYPHNQDFSIFVYSLTWLTFLIYWGCIIYNEESTEREEIVAQVGVETPNCPYCGISLAKFPYRKTRCKNCGNYMYVRTRPSDNKRILIQEDNIQELEAQWSKKNKNSIDIIDVTEEMDLIIEFLVNNYKIFCNYKQILEIEEKDRLELMRYIWEHWDVRINYKKLAEKFPQYRSSLLQDISLIETMRRYTFYKVQEFKDRGWDKEPLIKISGFDYTFLNSDVKFCTINTMIDVCDWSIEHFEEDHTGCCFLEMPCSIFNILDDKLPEKIFLFKNKNFEEVSLKELKQFCKENNYEYPYSE